MSQRNVEQDYRNVRGTVGFHLFVRLIQAELETEREQFENSTASEYNRGRVAALADFLEKVCPRG